MVSRLNVNFFSVPLRPYQLPVLQPLDEPRDHRSHLAPVEILEILKIQKRPDRAYWENTKNTKKEEKKTKPTGNDQMNLGNTHTALLE